MDEADILAHYNGKRFDIPILHREMLLQMMSAPSPSKQLDIMSVVKKNFAFPSYKLDYVAKQLGLGGKMKHSGMSMWVNAMAGDKKYNKDDVLLLESVHDRLGPWLPTLISKSYGMFACPHCGGVDLKPRGFEYTKVGYYQRYQCGSCFKWSNERTAQKVSELR